MSAVNILVFFSFALSLLQKKGATTKTDDRKKIKHTKWQSRHTLWFMAFVHKCAQRELKDRPKKETEEKKRLIDAKNVTRHDHYDHTQGEQRPEERQRMIETYERERVRFYFCIFYCNFPFDVFFSAESVNNTEEWIVSEKYIATIRLCPCTQTSLYSVVFHAK